MAAIGAVLFDLDDTLLDAESAWREGVRELVRRHGENRIDLHRATQAWEDVFDAWFDRYLSGEITLDGSRAGRIAEWARALGLEVPPGQELVWFQAYLEGYSRGWRVFPDTVAALEALEGVVLGVVTNGDGTQQRAKIAALGLDRFFEVVAVSAEVGLAKPDPGIFRWAAARAGVDPAACLMVGDRVDRDVTGALAAGMSAVWLRRPGTQAAASQPLSDRPPGAGTITTLADLPAVVARGVR